MHQPTLQTIKVGVFFLILFTSYTSFQLIVTYIYQNRGLTSAGPLNFIVNYLTFIISNFLAPKCKLSFKTQMIIGAIGSGFNVSTGLVVPYIESEAFAYFYIGLGGAVAGLVSGYMWVSQGGYLREAVKEESDKGKYSGIFQLLYSISGLIAGFITTFFLGFFSQQVYFIVLTLLCGIAAIFCLIFMKDTKQSSDNNLQVRQISIKQSVISTIKFSRNMWPILLMMVLDGLVLGMYSNQVIRLIPNEGTKQQMDRKAGIVTIFVGLGSVIGGITGGKLSDKFGLLQIGRSFVAFYLLSAVFNFIGIYEDEYVFICFIGACWGTSYYFFENWIYVAILKLYNGKLEAFSVNKILHSLAFVGFQTVILTTDNKVDLRLLILIVGSVSIPTFWCLNKENYSKQRRNGSTLNQEVNNAQYEGSQVTDSADRTA